MGLTRIRPDKQIMRAQAAGYVLISDDSGELVFQELSRLTGGTGTVYVRDITDVSLLGNNLVIKYLDANGNEQVKTTSLAAFAADVKVDNATLLQNPQAGAYTLHIQQSDGTSFDVDLKALLAVVTTNSTEITLSGDGTPQSPLRADLTQSVRDRLGAKNYTEEFTGLNNDSGKVVRLSRLPVAGTVKVYRNGIRQGTGDVFMTDRQDGTGDPHYVSFFTFFGSGVKDNETVIVDYQSLDDGGIVKG